MERGKTKNKYMEKEKCVITLTDRQAVTQGILPWTPRNLLLPTGQIRLLVSISLTPVVQNTKTPAVRKDWPLAGLKRGRDFQMRREVAPGKLLLSQITCIL